MVRTQIQLTERQARALKGAAARRHQSMATCVREAVDRWLASDAGRDPQTLRARALAVAGKFSSGHGRLSVDHDEALAEAFE